MKKNPFANRRYGRLLKRESTGEKYFAFEGYYLDSSVTEVDVPEEIDGIPVTSLTGMAFRWKKVRIVTLPDCIDELYDAFCDVETLERVNIPASVTQIKANAFRNCTALMELRIPATVTHIEDRLGSLPFYGCGGAKPTGKYRYETVEIPPSRVSLCGSDSETRYYHGDDIDIYNGYAVIPSRMAKVSIPEYANGPYGDLTLIVDKGSYAEDYARRMGIKFRYAE